MPRTKTIVKSIDLLDTASRCLVTLLDTFILPSPELATYLAKQIGQETGVTPSIVSIEQGGYDRSLQRLSRIYSIVIMPALFVLVAGLLIWSHHLDQH
jgi:hypothetical protein